MKQTAVEWLVDQLDEQVFRIDHVERRINISISFEDMMTLKKEAKEMEKEHIINANRDGVDMVVDNKKFITGEQYYNETYTDYDN
jgi:hypothetical protein